MAASENGITGFLSRIPFFQSDYPLVFINNPRGCLFWRADVAVVLDCSCLGIGSIDRYRAMGNLYR